MKANGKKKTKRKAYTWSSREARARCAEAGRRNLLAYRARVANKTHRTHGICEFINSGNLPFEVSERVTAFETEILSELRRKPNGRELALIASSKVALSIVLLASTRLSNLKRLGRSKWLLSTLATFMNALRLNLEVLGGDRTARKIEDGLPRVPDSDERDEADRIVREFIHGARAV